MATATRKGPLISGAIHTGADCLVSLIEEEKARAVSCAISELESRFVQFREAAAQSLALANSKCQRLEAKIAEITKAKLNESRAAASAMPSSYAAEETRAARTVATEWKKNLDHLKQALSSAGMEYVDGDVKFRSEFMTIITQLLGREPNTIHTASPESLLRILKGSVETRQVAFLQLEEKCLGLEMERDRLKDALQTEVAGLMAQIKSLQAEVKALQKPKLVVKTG